MIHRCHFTYEKHKNGQCYSESGLKKLDARLKNLQIFPYNQQEQTLEVHRHAGKISIQGIQPKLSAKLSVKNENFQLVDRDGEYIIKTQVNDYPELPQNEDLTMHLARLAGLNVPWHGLIKAKDNSLLYVIRRFDRLKNKKKLPQEDFAQLLGATRSTKYQSNMEKVCEIVEEFCSFPFLELENIFRLTLFSFLVGNEDLHLKNFSIQTTPKGVIKLTPVYDLVNTTIALVEPQEELALELNGKKRGLTKKDFIDYFAPEHCYIEKEKAVEILDSYLQLIPLFEVWIKKSFLSEELKKKYSKVLLQRAAILS
jgi:serine/threonine-protein kinase HipA